MMSISDVCITPHAAERAAERFWLDTRHGANPATWVAGQLEQALLHGAMRKRPGNAMAVDHQGITYVLATSRPGSVLPWSLVTVYRTADEVAA